MSNITLPWMDKIRERLEHYKDNNNIQEFIKPILEYGENEEKRINEEMDKNEIRGSYFRG